MAYTFSMAKSGRIDGVGEESEGATPQLSGWRTTLYIVLGIAGLIGGGELFVDGACGIARSLGVSEAVIGLTLVAGGTSLPELATSVVAARKGKSDIAIGNVVGSNLFNIFWILGMCATVSPLAVQGIRPADFAVLVASMVLFWLFARTKHRVARWEGAVLVACYAAYLTTLILA
jgi:cation:H+ antiporter